MKADCLTCTCLNQQGITVPSPGGIGMEKLIGLHMDKLFLIIKKEIKGGKMAERLGNGTEVIHREKT